MRSVVVLGGYGNFGRRVVATLATDREHRIFVAGRDLQKATALADEVGSPAEPIALDCRASALANQLRRLGATLVIHTAGPFQAQGYEVPRACIAARAHYIDLADGRAFVCGIRDLDCVARRNDVLVVSGASSLPALSSAVVDELRVRFSRIEYIEHVISSGARPPGQATMRGVLAYAGKPFMQWRHSDWEAAYGWQALTRKRFPAPVGTRWVANCDVPDLELFPCRYAPVDTVVFRAGVSYAASTLTLWLASWLVRAGLMRTLSAHAPPLRRTALALERFGSTWSAMQVTLRGLDHESRHASRTWTLLAGNNHGPDIPCFPAIALARKILRAEVAERGAMTCMGLLTLNEILAIGDGLDLHVVQSTA